MIIDGIIVLAIAICTYIGYKRGLINLAISLVAFFIAIVLALLLYKPVAKQIMDITSIDEKIEEKIEAKVEDSQKEEDSNDNFLEFVENMVKDSKDKTSSYIAESLTQTIIEGASFIILFIVIKLLLLIVSYLFKFITSLPIIKQFDKSGGLVYGLIFGIVLTYVVFSILYLTIPLLDDDKPAEYIDQSYIGKFFYEQNVIIKYISK